MSGWISVKERLPDAPGHYLVCTNVNYWHGGCMDKTKSINIVKAVRQLGFLAQQ